MADPHILFRQGIRRILDQRPDVEILGEAGNGHELLSLLGHLTLEHLAPDLVTMDISLPDFLGVETMRQIKATYLRTNVLIISVHQNKEYVDCALSAGARGYLLKKETDADLLPALEAIRQGELFISPFLAPMLKGSSSL